GGPVRFRLPPRHAAAAGLLVFALALGSPILLNGRVLAEAGPFALVEGVPVPNNILPMRLVLHSTIALFAVLGIGLEWCLAHLRHRRAHLLTGLLVVSPLRAGPGRQPAHELPVRAFYTESLAGGIRTGAGA